MPVGYLGLKRNSSPPVHVFFLKKMTVGTTQTSVASTVLLMKPVSSLLCSACDIKSCVYFGRPFFFLIYEVMFPCFGEQEKAIDTCFIASPVRQS